jgi:hypothetical protein
MSQQIKLAEMDLKQSIMSFTKLLLARIAAGDNVSEQLDALNSLRAQAGMKPIIIPQDDDGHGGQTGMVVHIPSDARMLPDNNQWTNRFQIKSESSGALYTIAQNKRKRYWGCDCPGWISRRKCKHLTSMGLPAHEEPFEAKLKQGSKTAAELMHSDDDLGLKTEVMGQEAHIPGPEAGASNDELHENAVADQGVGAPIFDGVLKSPERANVNALREALDTQVEMEVGKPISQKQDEVAMQEKVQDAALAQGAGGIAGSPGMAETVVDNMTAKPGTQIIINVASEKTALYEKYKCPDCGTPVAETMIGQGTQVPMGHCPKCGGGAKKLVPDDPYSRGGIGPNTMAPYMASVKKTAYVAHVPGHRNSKGEAAPWVIKQHNTDKILESFKSESAAKEGLKNMESHKGSDEKNAAIYENWCDPCIMRDHPEVMQSNAAGFGTQGNCEKCGNFSELRTVRPVKRSSTIQTEGIGGENQPGATAGHAGGAFGGTDLEGPTFHVGFSFRGLHREATFSSAEEADKFVKGASEKFGKLASGFTVTAAVDPAQKALVLEWLKTNNLTTGEVEKRLGGGKYSNKAYPILMELAKEGLIKHKQMRWYLKTGAYVEREELTPAGQATLGRIERAQPQLLTQYGSDAVLEAVYETTSHLGDLEEIGSSDVSIWVNNVAKSLERSKTAAPQGYPKYTVNGRIMKDYNDASDYWTVHGGVMMEKLDNMTPAHVLQEKPLSSKSAAERCTCQGKSCGHKPGACDKPAASSAGFIACKECRAQHESDVAKHWSATDKTAEVSPVPLNMSCYVLDEFGDVEAATNCSTREEVNQFYHEQGVDDLENVQSKTNGDKVQYVYKRAALTALRQANVRLKMAEMSVPEKHALRIAIQTLKMPDAMVGVMGGPDKASALKTLERHGYRWDDADYMAGGSGLKRASKTAGDGMAKTEEELQKEAGFNFFFPGQVLKEFYPEIQHEIVDYPNATNQPMSGAGVPEMVGDGGHELEGLLDSALDTTVVEMIQLPADVGEVEPMQMAAADYSSTSPAGGMGIGRDGKPEVLEGAPLRKENDIRGYMFTDEFYGQYEGIPGAAMQVAGKTAAGEEGKQFKQFLKLVCGEIAATMVAAFKVTARPLLDKVPGIGEIQLDQIEQGGASQAPGVTTQGGRMQYILSKLNDSDIKGAINEAWAQAAVWNDNPDGGFVYEVFVRPETIDTDSLKMTYKFICGTRE